MFKKLTFKQSQFILKVLEGNSQTSAYINAYNTQNMSQKTFWEESSQPNRHFMVAISIWLELEAEKEPRWRMQALSREDRVLQELEKIAFGDGPTAGRLKALEMPSYHIGKSH